MRKIEAPPLDLQVEGLQIFVNGREPHGQVRLLAEMEGISADKSLLRDLDMGAPAYFMYDDLFPATKESSLRYDVTVIPPGMFGKEFMKTMGHYHSSARPGLSYPELYQILSGTAHFLLQLRNDSGAVDRVLLVEARAGEMILVPPNWGHVTINPEKEPLVFCDLVSLFCESDYSEYLERKGGAFWEMGDGQVVLNPSYREKVQLERASAADPSLKQLLYERCLSSPIVWSILDSRDHILAQYVANPSAFDFLSGPDKM